MRWRRRPREARRAEHVLRRRCVLAASGRAQRAAAPAAGAGAAARRRSARAFVSVAADDVAQVRHVVHVGQRARDQDVALACVRRGRCVAALRCRGRATLAAHSRTVLMRGLGSWMAASACDALVLGPALLSAERSRCRHLADHCSLFTALGKPCMHVWLANAWSSSMGEHGGGRGQPCSPCMRQGSGVASSL